MPGLKAKKRTRGKPVRRAFPWLGITVAAFVAVFAVAVVLIGPPPNPLGSLEPSAAIVDQLSIGYPNEDFIIEVTQDLEDYGFQVDIYQGDEITVDFYRNLPAYDYKVIVFRAHSGALGPVPDPSQMIGTYLFTNEPGSTLKYPKEQLNNELARASPTGSQPELFAIGPRFVTYSTRGTFDDTVIIIDGCSCLHKVDLALALVDRGASACLAWDAPVNLDYVDEATSYFMELLCVRKLTMEQAVRDTMAEKGSDPQYGAVLQYYPPKSAQKTLKQLIE